jgi:hypothetical protein
MNELQNPWIILNSDTISARDYIIGAENPLVIPPNLNTDKYLYNQWIKRTPTTAWSCWLFSAMWCISDLTGYQFTEEDIQEINALAISTYWLLIWVWMYMSRAIDCVRDWWNAKFPDKKLLSFRWVVWDDQFIEWLNKGHSFAVWYHTSSDYLKDSQDNWVINKDNFPTDWGGHLVRTNFEDTINIDDNYEWTKDYNTYVNNKIKDLKDKWVYFPSAYLFLYDLSMEDQIINNIDLEWAKAEYLLWTWSWMNPRDNMSRQEVMQVINNLRKDLTK